MGVWFLSTALANKVAGDLSGYYPEDVHKKSAYGAPQFAANMSGMDTTVVVDANTTFFANNAKPGMWTVATTADNKPEAPEKHGMEKFMANMTADPLVDYFTASEETDVVKSVAISNENVPAIEEHKLKQISPKGEKTKFSIGVSQDGNTAYVLKMTPDEINKEKMNVAFEVWDLNPKKPSIFGQEISNLYEFFVVFIILAGVASVLLFFLSKTLLRMMHGLR
jgi:POT family proton-dependent oligopeptide transporter